MPTYGATAQGVEAAGAAAAVAAVADAEDIQNEQMAANNNNRFNMQQMVGRLREFLNTMEQHFPAANPVLNQENNEDDNFDESHEYD